MMRTLRHLCVILLTLLISFGSSTDEDFPHQPLPPSLPVGAGQPPVLPVAAAQVQQQQHYEELLHDDTGIAEARGAEGCNFPSKWEGSWFQSGVHQVITISRSVINTKGRCLETDREKYLYIVFNELLCCRLEEKVAAGVSKTFVPSTAPCIERDSCYRCVVFTEKHYNVLQYKETFCVRERSSLKQICSTISGDANLFAMFRLDGVPIECPFKGPFSFTYNHGQGDCIYPVSSAEPCLHSSRYLLNFQACPDVKGTESAAEELQCLATWKEGSSRYLLGLIQYRHPSSYEERFRCFVYERSKKTGVTANSFANLSDNAIVRLAQSGDATCNGLSLHEGSRTMTLKRAPSTKPCQFPSWLQTHTQWHTLDQRSTFVFESNKLRVSNSSDLGGGTGGVGGAGTGMGSYSNSYGFGGGGGSNAAGGSSGSGSGPSSVTMIATCSQILENPTADKVMHVLHSTAGCRSGYVCSVFYKRHGHIVELQLGNMARRAEDACHIQNFNQSQLPYITLVSSTPETRQCPNLGRFQITGILREGKRAENNKCDNTKSTGGGAGGANARSSSSSSARTAQRSGHGEFDTLNVGCYSLDTLQLRSECSNSPDFSAEYACHGSWEEMGLSYLVATPLSRSSTGAKRYCFVYRETVDLSQQQQLQAKLRLKSAMAISGSNNVNALSSMEQQIEEAAFGRILHFSTITDSCRRGIVPGVEGSIAFNVTAFGQCTDINSSPRIQSFILSSLAYQCGLVLFVFVTVLHTAGWIQVVVV